MCECKDGKNLINNTKIIFVAHDEGKEPLFSEEFDVECSTKTTFLVSPEQTEEQKKAIQKILDKPYMVFNSIEELAEYQEKQRKQEEE